VEWAVLSEIDDEAAGTALERLRLRFLGPRSGLPTLALPEQGLILARRAGLIIVAPESRTGLFDDVLKSLFEPDQATLADEAPLAQARALGRGAAGVFIRHSAQQGGGWSAAVASVQGPHLRVRHIARFDDPPFSGPVTRLVYDMTPLRQVEDRSILAMIQPTDTGGLLDQFLTMELGMPLVDSAMRRHLGSRKLTTLGDREGRLLDPPVDLLLPTAALCLEVRGDATAADQLDERMVRLVKRLQDRGQGACLIDLPDLCAAPPGQPRYVDLSPAAGCLIGGFPIMRSISLNWTLAEGPGGNWWVVASDPRHLQEVVAGLTGPRCGEPMVGSWDSCGSINAARLGAQVVSWGERAELIADPDHVNELRQSLAWIGRLAGAADRCRWKLSRPSERETALEVDVTLAPADSGGSEPGSGEAPAAPPR
jgi:hypothetical protein